VHDNDAWADMKKNGYQRPLGLRGHPHAQEHRRRLHHRRAVRCWLRADLAHVVPAVALRRPVVATIVHTFNYKRDYYIPADEVVRTEAARTPVE
jgi:cytochrome o ubiquinol oxidase subunit 1